MKRYLIWFGVFICLASNAQDKLGEIYGTWIDAKREREIPYRIIYEEGLSGLSPLVLLSHGLGGDTQSMSYLSQFLAAKGYVCVHLQHPGSDASLWEGTTEASEIREKLKNSLNTPANAINRFEDVPFALDQCENLSTLLPNVDIQIDWDRVAIIGHSYGAITVLTAAGQAMGRFGNRFKDDRIKAAIALSPSQPRRHNASTYTQVDIPILHITGTADGNPVQNNANFDPNSRRFPFDQIKARGQHLIILDQAVHATFSGNSRARFQDRLLDEHLEAVKQSALAFLSFHLNQEDGANPELLAKQLTKFLTDKDLNEWH